MIGSSLYRICICPMLLHRHGSSQTVLTSEISIPVKSVYEIATLSLVLLFAALICIFPDNVSAEITTDTAANAKEIAQGKRVFRQSCAYCHQADAIGKPGIAPSLSNKEFLSITSDKFLVGTIRDGRTGTGMPLFSYLGEKAINEVVAYLRSLAVLPSRVKEIESQPKSKGNWRPGKKLFNNICLGCHGPNGSGYISGGTGTAIGKAGFLSKVSDGFIRTTIKEGRSNTRMRSFQGPEGLANLTNDEIDDIIAFLRTNPSKD
jgi:cbb3-type cytochrome c oxidase subunit III